MFKLINIIVTAAVLPAALALCTACSSEHGGAGGDGSGGSATTGSTGTAGAGTTSTGTGTCPQYMDPVGTDLMTPVVMFKTQVMPFFNDNCGAVACHGSASPTGGVFLGASTAMGSDSAKVYTAIVGKMGDELPTMDFVKAGDPINSYLMHKLDGDQCQFNTQCASESCLADMPSGLGMLLPAMNRDIVRRWIAQGAKND